MQAQVRMVKSTIDLPNLPNAPKYYSTRSKWRPTLTVRNKIALSAKGA